MIKNLEDLWNKLQPEFNNINKRIDGLEKNFNEKIEDLENRFDEKLVNLKNEFDEKLGSLESKFNERFNSLESEFNERFNSLESKFNERFNSLESKFNERFDKVEARFEGIENKLDVITNVNLAQILNEQTRTRIELNKKLDNYIAKNELEHKKIEYALTNANIDIKYKYNAN